MAEYIPSLEEDVENIETFCNTRVNLLPYYRADPELWFSQVDAQFNITNITEDLTKYYNVIAVIDTEVLAKMSDFIKFPPLQNKYKSLKECIIQQFKETEKQKLSKLLNGVEFTGKKPSQVLQEMRIITENKLCDDFLKSYWLNGLPTQTKNILSICTETLDKLAEMADTLVQFLEKPVVLPVKDWKESSRDLIEQMEHLNQKLLALGLSTPDCKKGLTNTSTHLGNDWKNYCWYHYTYGQNARKCQQPCLYW